MGNEQYVVMKVECSNCKTKQKIHVVAGADSSETADRAVQCIQCEKHFRVSVTSRVLRGPFPI